MAKLRSPFVHAGLWLVSFRFWSRLWGRAARIRRPRFFSRWLIRKFAKGYGIRMDEYRGDLLDYPSLSDFFVRPLDPATRPLSAQADFFLSPADGCLSRLETLMSDIVLQVKGHAYPLSAILGEGLDFSHPWQAATIYLAPHNYHRFHYPVTARIKAALHTGTRLFPVNALSAGLIRRLFIRNERISLRLERGGERFYFVAVGATFVGGIRLEALPASLPQGAWYPLDVLATQAAEAGRFEQGSTIILAFPASWAKSWLVREGDSLRAGEPLFLFNR